MHSLISTVTHAYTRGYMYTRTHAYNSHTSHAPTDIHAHTSQTSRTFIPRTHISLTQPHTQLTRLPEPPSSFQSLLLHLPFQVLSSKLMPTSDDEMAKTSVKSFCENFLKAGGLRYDFQHSDISASNAGCLAQIAMSINIILLTYKCNRYAFNTIVQQLHAALVQ